MSHVPPLSARIVQANVFLDHADHVASMSIGPYTGEPLFFHASSDGAVLSIDINETPFSDVIPPALGASQVKITVTYGTPPQTASATFKNVTYTGRTPLAFRTKMTSGLDQVFITVTDEIPSTPSRTDPKFGFVLVRERTTVEPVYRVEFVENAAFVEDASNRVAALVIPPNPIAGGVLGPMGVELP